ncbi:dihydrofolate reductase family protein [Rhodococcus sp. T2V]|uniref:dihydrofolate reductase family protein n=1 Tax=Rhodococcus sp. T2V TaxID=3034164 RepID=UPI0031FE88BA
MAHLRSPSARATNEIPKVVLSRTLKSAVRLGPGWFSGDAAEEIATLEAEPGKDLAAGGIEFVNSLIKLGVVDEYRLWVLPAATGKRRRCCRSWISP